jgi:(1->4)-alpha-D-glucan 1-alpha-D-glucosylmutase
VFAFLRSRGTEHVLVAVPRLVATLSPDAQWPLGERIWGDTRVLLPRNALAPFHDVFLERCVDIRQDGARSYVLAADLFAHFPVACLEAGSQAS